MALVTPPREGTKASRTKRPARSGPSAVAGARLRLMGPVVGITAYAEDARWGASQQAVLVPEGYIEKVIAAGGHPVVLPADLDPGAVLSRLDALVIAGGADLDAALYGDEPHAANDLPRTAATSTSSRPTRRAQGRAARPRHLPRDAGHGGRARRPARPAPAGRRRRRPPPPGTRHVQLARGDARARLARRAHPRRRRGSRSTPRTTRRSRTPGASS